MVLRILWHLDRHPIARFPVGRGGAVAGVVADGTRSSPALRGPLTGRPCAAYQLLIWAMMGPTPVDTPVVFENCCAPFEIDDGSGLVRVAPRAAELALSYRRIASGTPGVDLPSDLIPALTRSGFAGPWGRYGFEERSLLPGDWVVVCGTGALEPDPRAPGDPGYREGAPSRLVLGASPAFPLAISNDASLRVQPRQTVRLV
ncbi:MAG TPA: hypothetical protein VK698_28585 [Kofleriaceae bacterium]|nr:hypothetical protein [Kofleriaceae bacterium]